VSLPEPPEIVSDEFVPTKLSLPLPPLIVLMVFLRLYQQVGPFRAVSSGAIGCNFCATSSAGAGEGTE
jgi:hypothetical protein